MINSGLAGAKMRRFFFIAACVFLAALPNTNAEAESGYRVAKRISTAHGAIEILDDSRLTPALERKLLHGCADPLEILDENDPLAKSFNRDQVRPARLRQIDAQGRAISDFLLEKDAPVANIDLELGPKSDPIFVVGYNDYACMGSYSGFVRALFKFSRGRLATVEAKNEQGKPQPIRLFSSLKADWKFLKNAPDNIEIVQVFCQPDFAHETKTQMAFQIIYRTYRLQGGVWRVRQRHDPGFWENDGVFPPRSKFP